MDYESFKEQFIADVKDALADQGQDMKISVSRINKLNESYEAITVTPEGSNVGVNMSLEKFYGAVEDGISYESLKNSQQGNYVLCVVTRFLHRSSSILIDKQAIECYYLILANANHDCVGLMQRGAIKRLRAAKGGVYGCAGKTWR